MRCQGFLWKLAETTPRGFFLIMEKDKFLSRRAAAQILRVVPQTLDKLAEKHGVEIFQVKGHSRRWYSADGIRGLVNDSSMKAEG
jgi:hypothetical protein